MTIELYNVIQKPSLFKMSGDVFVAKQKNNCSKRWRCCQHSSGWFPLSWPSLNIIWLVVEPPLWKIWVRSVGVIIPIYMERHKIPWFQSPPTSHSLRKTQTDLPENLTECGCQVSQESQPYRGCGEVGFVKIGWIYWYSMIFHHDIPYKHDRFVISMIYLWFLNIPPWYTMIIWGYTYTGM